MAGLTVHIGSTDRSRIVSAAGRLRFYEEAVQIVSEPGFSAAWVGHDDPLLFGPANDPATGVRVLSSGRPACDEPDWRRADELTKYEGGLANRLLLERYLEGGAEAVGAPNGPCAVVVWDPRSRVVHLWTDHFGYQPVFLYRADSPSNAIIGTFPDAMADDAAVHATLDEVSVAEFLSAWRVTPPHTYYKEIRYAGAASHHVWNLGADTYARSEYWKPTARLPFPDCEAGAEELAHAVKAAVRIRTLKRLGPVVSFTSGGMDSRTVLFAAASPADIVGVNLYDEPGHETAVARRLCEVAGVQFVGFQRDRDYYPRWLQPGVRLSGAMWSHEDNHYLGAREAVMGLGARTVVSACTTDWLFKGYGLEKAHRRFLGRNLPLNRFVNERVDGFLPNVPRSVPEQFAADVHGRLDEWFSGTPRHLVSDGDRLAVEDRRARPACYAVSVSGQIMYRIFPYDTFLADSRIADCYSRIRAEWKLNGDIWGKAVRRICARGSGDRGFELRLARGLIDARESRSVRARLAPPAAQARRTASRWPGHGVLAQPRLVCTKQLDSEGCLGVRLA